MKKPPALNGRCTVKAVRTFSPLRMLSVLLSFLMLTPVLHAQMIAPSPDDVAEAQLLSRKYKDEAVVCRTSHHTFSFDKGKNALGDKVVTVQEETDLDFLSLKKFASLTYHIISLS